MFVPLSLARLLSAAATVAGLVHLIAPRPLLAIAERSYGVVLSVEFQPREDAPTRVRAIGVLFLVVGAELYRRTE